LRFNNSSKQVLLGEPHALPTNETDSFLMNDDSGQEHLRHASGMATIGPNCYTIVIEHGYAHLGLLRGAKLTLDPDDAGSVARRDVVAVWWRWRPNAGPTLMRLSAHPMSLALQKQGPLLMVDGERGEVRAYFLSVIDRVHKVVKAVN
jgi:hypothetical protein